MKILFLCNKSPWPPKEGGPIAMNMLIEGLVMAGHSVKVLAINSFKYQVDPELIPREYADQTGIELIGLDLKVKPLAAFLNLFTRRSYHVVRFISERFRNKLIQVLTSDRYDIVQLETLYLCPYIDTVRKYSEAKIVLRAHNIEHLIWERVAGEAANPLKRLYLRHLAKTLKEFEMGVLNRLDGIAAITANDAGFFRNVLEGEQPSAAGSRWAAVPVIDIPFGIDPEQYPFSPEKAEFPSLFTIGAMNWIPNEEGVRWFIKNVWPDVHRQYPELKYYLAGREMPQWMKLLDLTNVVVIGEVENAYEFMTSRSIMIVPLFSGSGIRIKIIEGMACGKTIISTRLGAEGIDYTNRENILIADLPCEFFDMITICAGDEEYCRQIGKNGRDLVIRRFNRESIIEKLVGFYRTILG